jgi:ATP-dependent helicase/nuclease subunit B
VSSPAVFTIPPHRAFADALAAGLLATFTDPMELARGIVLLPNNRAARALTDAFVRRADGGLLLPRLVAIGDVDLAEQVGAALDPIGADDPPPPAIEPVRRQYLLARLVQRERIRSGQPIDAAEAMRLAADLARTLDQLHVEQIDPHRLSDLAVAPELSDHWRKSLDQLTVILDQWPTELDRLGRIDLSQRRNLLLGQVSRRWQATPPAGFVVAAGITTTAPAVCGLLRTVSRLPHGMVVVPALDDEMPQVEWDALGPHDPDPDTGIRRRSIETHPQYQLKLMLDRMGVGRGEVTRWRWGGGHDARASRSRAIANALAPAEVTGKWNGLKAEDRRLSGVRAVEVATPADEAQTIAIALREAVETPGRTAALITPDRDLATRVSAHLARWNIEADDSAGRPLSSTPPGTLLLALAEAAAERFAPVPLLGLLKHPLVAAGEGRVAWLEGARRLDIALRGPRPAPGLAGVSAYLAAGDERERRIRAPAQSWWADVRRRLEPLEALFASDRPAPLGDYLAALREAVMALAGDEAWARPAGRAAADLFAELEAYAGDGPGDVRPAAIAPMLADLMRAVPVRPPQGGHPRVSIWGLLEARLQQADLMVLGGLNEGTWPALPAPDPWLAPRIRSELGLPGLDRRIGLSAHDFASALGAPRVLVTRARRDARAPAIASRFWLRLEAMTGGMTRETALDAYAQALDDPGVHAPADRPAPVPPVADRPKAISVTDVDRLKADPYAFYARKMLRLSPLDPIDADPSAAWRGNAVHAVLDAWAREDDWEPSRLRPRAHAMLRGADAHPMMRALWEPRLMEAIDWIAETIAANRQDGRVPAKAEIWSAIEIAGVTLGGRVDRIDQLADGSLAIVDYKSGSPPSATQVGAGFAQQLGLLGLIAERAGFDGLVGTATAFEYWSLARNKDGGFGYVKSPVHPEGKRGSIVTDRFTAVAAANFTDAAERWLTGAEPFTAKLHPEHAPYGDYDQLMRLDEWYGRNDG